MTIDAWTISKSKTSVKFDRIFFDRRNFDGTFFVKFTVPSNNYHIWQLPIHSEFLIISIQSVRQIFFLNLRFKWHFSCGIYPQCFRNIEYVTLFSDLLDLQQAKVEGKMCLRAKILKYSSKICGGVCSILKF